MRERLAARVKRYSHVRHLAREPGCLCFAKALPCCDQSVECIAMLPVELVHGPCRAGRLAQRLYQLRFVATSGLLQPLGEGIASGGELCQWKPVQNIDFIVKPGLRLTHEELLFQSVQRNPNLA